MASDRPIFVAGCPRSGTTLLQLMLHAHPRIAIPPENRFVLPTYERRQEFGDLRKPENRRRVAESITGERRMQFGDFGLDTDDITEKIVAGPPTVGSALGVVFREYAAQYGKPRWGDKRPGYHAHLPLILRMFPDAQIIYMVRDGRDSVASLKYMPWWKKSLHRSITAWMLAARNAQRAERRLPSDTFYQLQYERLVADPAKELHALCEFLGEDFDDAMTHPADQAKVAVPERKSWHARTHEEVSTAAVGGWQEKLTPAEQAICEAVMGRRLRAYGYELTGNGPRPSPRRYLGYGRTMGRRRMNVYNRHIRDRYNLLRDRAPVQAVLTAGQQERLSASDRSWIAGER